MEEDMSQVLPSPGKGLGVFATKDITPGTLIHSEAPTIVIPKPSGTIKDEDITAAVYHLTPSERDLFYSLSAPPTHHKSEGLRIFFGNGFAYPYPSGQIQSTCLCVRTARFNHSCLPNAELAFHPYTGRCEIFATKPIAQGEEICFCYLQESHCMPRSYRQFMQFLTWRFVCSCPACEPAGAFCEESDERRKAMYVLRAQLEGFSLPVLSMKLVLRTGVPMAEVWKPGELQRILAGMWMPMSSAWMQGQKDLEERIAGLVELMALMEEEALNGREVSRYCTMLIPLLSEKAEAEADAAGVDVLSRLSSAKSEARRWADRGLESIKSCRALEHPDVVEYERTYQVWASNTRFG